MANTDDTLESFAEEVRRVLGRSLADLGLGSRDRAINALGELLTKAETIVHGKAMANEAANPERFDLATLEPLLVLNNPAPEREG